MAASVGSSSGASNASPRAGPSGRPGEAGYAGPLPAFAGAGSEPHAGRPRRQAGHSAAYSGGSQRGGEPRFTTPPAVIPAPISMRQALTAVSSEAATRPVMGETGALLADAGIEGHQWGLGHALGTGSPLAECREAKIVGFPPTGRVSVDQVAGAVVGRLLQRGDRAHRRVRHRQDPSDDRTLRGRLPPEAAGSVRNGCRAHQRAGRGQAPDGPEAGPGPLVTL